MAYRFKGDPNWDQLLHIYGPRSPLPEFIIVSSDDNDEGDADNVQLEPTTGADSDANQHGSLPTQQSRNIQRSMWEYIGYASDSEDMSIDNNCSTANSQKQMRCPRDANVVDAGSTSTRKAVRHTSVNNSSCASNDPFGKRRL